MYVWINHLYKRTNHYINPNRDLQNYKKGIPNGIRLANFGTTNSYYAFKSHDELGIKSFNFALNCESIEMDLDILKEYASHLTKGCIVILQLNFCVCIYRRNKLDESRKAWIILPQRNHIKVSLKQRFKNVFSVSPIDIKKISRIIFDVDDNSLENLKFVDKKKSVKNAEDMIKCWTTLFNIESLKTSNLGEQNLEEIQFNTEKVEEFMRFCQSNEFYPVLACTPIGKDLNSYISDKFGNITLDAIEKKAKRLNVPFLNYRKDDRFQNELSLFMDGGYKMTRRGSMKYLKILLNDIHRYYHLPISNKTLN